MAMCRWRGFTVEESKVGLLGLLKHYKEAKCCESRKVALRIARHARPCSFNGTLHVHTVGIASISSMSDIMTFFTFSQRKVRNLKKFW